MGYIRVHGLSEIRNEPISVLHFDPLDRQALLSAPIPFTCV